MMRDKTKERLKKRREILTATKAKALPAPADTPALVHAFEYFGLNPMVQAHRHILLVALAEEVFPRKRGRPVGGTTLIMLGVFYRGYIQKNPGATDSQAAAHLKRKLGLLGPTEDSIRKRLPAARRELAKMDSWLARKAGQPGPPKPRGRGILANIEEPAS
jgi:hypothetical protein